METTPTCHVFALQFIQTTTPAIWYWSHLVQHVSEFVGLLTMRTWVITAIAIHLWLRSRDLLNLQVYSGNAAHMCHICTHVPCFLNASEATQFSGSWHFQICLPAPAPSSSSLFPPMTFRLAFVVRSYLLLLTTFLYLWLSLRFFSSRFQCIASLYCGRFIWFVC